MQTGTDITLYSYAMSPYAAKVHAALLYKELPFDLRYINPLRARKELPIGHQVPAVTVGDEARNDSTPILLWLDELFPEKPLLPADGPERDKLLAIDQWISDELIPGSFRSYPGEGGDKWVNGWKLSHVMAATAHSGLPWIAKWLWPMLVTRVRFVTTLVAHAASGGLSVHDAKFKLYDDFIARLDGGPFLGGRSSPSLPDFAAYPQFAIFWMVGFRHADDILQRPAIWQWLNDMRPHIDKQPPILPPHARVNDIPGENTAFRSPFFPDLGT